MRVIARLNIGGPAIHVVLLNAGLDPARFESVLISGSENPGEGTMLGYALSRGVQPVVVPEMIADASLRARDIRALVKLYRHIRRIGPHIVHTHTAKAGCLGRVAARLAGAPVIVHTYHGHVLHGYYGPLTNWVLRWMERLLARITDRIVAVSEQVKRDLVAYGVAPSEKIVVIPLGFELQPFVDSSGSRGTFRRELGFTNGERLVGTVGRIFPVKNHRLFLDAAARVAGQERQARFVVVGDGLLRPALERHARDLGIADRVVFTGWRRDLPAIYADLDVLVVSSNNEGTPVSVIEAMAAGRPVVATRVGGLPDLVAEGETGFLVSPGNADELAAGVLRLLRDPRTASRMGETARRTTRERFALARLIADTGRLYDQLLIRKGISA
ncbi:MAG TPA: glycosyltransferase [Nitrospiraceae bacterium]|nr:glycosyltransferase [Nitrospiraceae bacterium]